MARKENSPVGKEENAVCGDIVIFTADEE